MTLDEAIKNAEKLAELNEDQARVYKEQGDTLGSWSYEECANEHRQLAEWLMELKEYRKFYSCYNCYNASASFNEYPCNVCRRGLEATKNIKDHYKEVNADDK